MPRVDASGEPLAAGLQDAIAQIRKQFGPTGEGGCAGEGGCWIVPVVVECDEDCGALEDPQSDDEIRAAYEHWRYHGYLSGCAHGR